MDGTAFDRTGFDRAGADDRVRVRMFSISLTISGVGDIRNQPRSQDLFADGLGRFVNLSCTVFPRAAVGTSLSCLLIDLEDTAFSARNRVPIDRSVADHSIPNCRVSR